MVDIHNRESLVYRAKAREQCAIEESERNQDRSSGDPEMILRVC